MHIFHIDTIEDVKKSVNLFLPATYTGLPKYVTR
jgi:hypothetical protein